MSRKTLVILLLVVLVLSAVWALTAYQRARKTQELLTALAERDDAAATEAMAQLRHRGPKVGLRLVGYLTSENERVRWRAAVLCAEVGAKQSEVVDGLVRLLVDPVPAVQRAAALACGALQLEEAEQPLIALVSNKEQTPSSRAFAAEALGSLRSEDAVEPLTTLLRERPPVPPKEPEAAVAEAKPTAPAAPPPPPDDLWQARWQAAMALGEIGTAKCVEVLAESVRADLEPRIDVRMAAAYALADALANPDARKALGTGVDALLQAMSDEAGDVRVAAAISLARTYPPKDKVPQVETTLREHLDDDHYWVREAVKLAMAQLKISRTG
ncbi:MAG: HEAT repeat domain-containing protein [Armatimonadota bacterium]